ncbi:MAG: hypothetical protein IBX36_00660 [Dehalococcoidia bacterium]|nr:hypothetical protein [Dehalococcoidia bacterium]
MSDGNNHYNNSEEELIAAEIEAVAERIYRAHLPPYLQESWASGRGNWYEELLREQLDNLVISEVHDDPDRLADLEGIEDSVALVFGIFGTAFRLLDHIGMHLRGQTFGQYELLADDEMLLRDLCQRFLQTKELDLNPFRSLFDKI